MAMATPIAHKGATAGAKVLAATMLDLYQDKALREDAWIYFREEQSENVQYKPFIGLNDSPAIEKNRAIMNEFRDRLEPLYYDYKRYRTYLEQLGINYPQLKKPSTTDP